METFQINEEFKEFDHPFMDMMKKYMSIWNDNLIWITRAKNFIVLRTPDEPPIHSAPYRDGFKQRKQENEKIDRMREAGVAEPVITGCASPVVFVLKKDGSLRFCEYYRRLNAVIVWDGYPILHMDKSVDSLGDAQNVSTLDTNCSYWQIEIDKKDVEKTSSMTHHRIFK